DVALERLVEDHHQHPVRPEAALVGEAQVGEPVQADGGLAAAGTALDDDQAAVRRGDELELARIDQRRDLGEEAVLATVAVPPDAELARLVVLLGAHRRALAAREPARALAGAEPGAVAAADERALRRADALELPAVDRDGAAGEDLAVHLAPAELLVVFVAFF